MKLLIAIILLSTVNVFAQSDSTFVIVEEAAKFPGGMGKYYKYVSDNLVYPKDAKKQNAKGTVYIEFRVKADGYVDKDSMFALPLEFVKGQNLPMIPSNARDVPQSCKDEAIRVVKSSPQWIPGKRRGVPVRQVMVLPISFGGR